MTLSDTADGRYGTRAAWLLGILLALKLALLFRFGPSIFPDSNGYLAIGDEILKGTRWLDDGGWGTGLAPVLILRPYGYPLLVALAKLAGGSHFALVLAAAQCIASIAALGVVAATLPALVRSPGLRYAVLVLAALSGSSLYDISLLSDSFYASLFIAVVFTIASAVAGQRRLGPLACAALGLAWGYSIWLRDAGLYFTFFPLLGLLAAAWLERGRARAAVASLACFLLPAVALVALHMLWNDHRTGHFILSVSEGMNWLWPSINIVAIGLANPFDGGDLVSRVVASHNIEPGLGGMYQIVELLWREYRLDPLEIKRVALDHFIGTVGRHPLAYLATIPHNFQLERLANLLFSPLANLNDYLQLGPTKNPRFVPGVRELREMFRAGSWASAIGFGGIVLAFEAAALAGLAVVVLGTPVAAFRRRHAGIDRRDAAAAFLWLSFMGMIGAYALVHLEMRYALPVVPAALAAFAYTLDRWRRREP